MSVARRLLPLACLAAAIAAAGCGSAGSGGGGNPDGGTSAAGGGIADGGSGGSGGTGGDGGTVNATGTDAGAGGTILGTGGNDGGAGNGQPGSSAVCGNGVIEPPEQCDDGNTLPFDGCSAECKRELDCTHGACTGFCGDGIVSPGEECDDGNNVSGDGCSATCKLETGNGWYCTNMNAALPDTISVPVVFRDMRGSDETSVPGVLPCPVGPGPFASLLASGCAHPDFEAFFGLQETPRLLAASLGSVAGRPAVLMPRFDTATAGLHRPSDPLNYSDVQITSADTFAQWYTDVPGVNRTLVGKLLLNRVPGTNTYLIDRSFNSGGFFPLDGAPATWPCPTGEQCGWGITPRTRGTSYEHDFGFTTETRYQFTYQGGEVLTFTGDDDVWVFIGGKLAVDLGGLHSAVTKSVTLDDATAAALGLTKGLIYEMALFHAERHTTSSNFTLTLGGFVKNTTVCHSVCGDGIQAPDEECDLGPANGPTSICSAACKMQAPK